MLKYRFASRLGLAAAAIALLSLQPAASNAQVVLDQLHVDIDIAYNTVAEAWELGIHDEDNDIEYEVDEASFGVNANAIEARPVGANFDFIGVAAGVNYFRLPDVEDPDLNFIGIAAEEISLGTFTQRTITDPRLSGGSVTGEYVDVTLLSVSGPGEFSVWSSNGNDPRVWMATSNGISTNDIFYALVGSHTDLNFGFTVEGIYDVTLQASATRVGTLNPTISPATTYRFVVSSAPEPSAVALFSLGLVGFGATKVRRRRSSTR